MAISGSVNAYNHILAACKGGHKYHKYKDRTEDYLSFEIRSLLLHTKPTCGPERSTLLFRMFLYVLVGPKTASHFHQVQVPPLVPLPGRPLLNRVCKLFSRRIHL